MPARKSARSSEFDLIEHIARASRSGRKDLVLGIGDDAALLRVPAAEHLVVTVDTLIAGVHFPLATAAGAVGWKALAVNLSDLAAMGALPRWCTLALTLPDPDREWLNGFLRGMHRLAHQHQVALVGGDTTRGPLSITVQAMGSVPPGRALRRVGARKGDAVFVSGTLGDAAAGLAIMQARLQHVAPADQRALRKRLEQPTPRIALGMALRGVASACIDVSDGLAQDLGHLLSASGVGAVIDAAALPTSAALRRCVHEQTARIDLALCGGDDYELCFAVPPRRCAAISALASTLRLPLTRIGTISAGDGLRIQAADGRALNPAGRGYDHFA